MYILVDCEHCRSGQKVTKGYESFQEIKDEVISILNSRGWDNKNQVDLRKVCDCLNYILNGNYKNIKYKFTPSYNKYLIYKYGYKTLV